MTVLADFRALESFTILAAIAERAGVAPALGATGSMELG
jgi:hypothetical protein